MATGNLKMSLPISDSDSSKVAYYNAVDIDLDAVIAGMLTLSVAGSLNINLTRIQAMNRVMKFTGTLTGNIDILIDPALGCARIFTVWNATTGAFTLTVKTTAVGSTGITVSQDSKAELLHDGTHVYYASAEVI